ncbi:hypothetical protein K8I28_13415, partial [bacterium]|nr:hypothetical protein [bacterium]
MNRIRRIHEMRVGFATDIGKRKENQDSGITIKLEDQNGPFVLINVCDGMCGYPQGRAASQICTRVLSRILEPALELRARSLSPEELETNLSKLIRRNAEEMVENLRTAYLDYKWKVGFEYRQDDHGIDSPPPKKFKIAEKLKSIGKPRPTLESEFDIKNEEPDEFSPPAFYSTLTAAIGPFHVSGAKSVFYIWWIGDSRLY